jgi:STE24 endopeptidase
LTQDEIVAVLAHEIGHYRKKHVLINMIFSILTTGIMLFLFSLIANSKVLAASIGISVSSFHVSLVVFGILYGPASLLLGIVSNIFSRKHEYQADAFVKEKGLSQHLVSALKKLSVTNLSNLTPHSLYAFFHYSHPPLLKRLERLES